MAFRPLVILSWFLIFKSYYSFLTIPRHLHTTSRYDNIARVSSGWRSASVNSQNIAPINNHSSDSGGRIIPTPPKAYRDPNSYVYFGGKRQTSKNLGFPESPQHGKLWDPYGWMRDDTRQNTTVRAAIDEENDYVDRVVTDQLQLKSGLHGELVQELSEDLLTSNTLSQVYIHKGYYYYTQRVQESPFPLHFRMPLAVVNGSSTLDELHAENIRNEILVLNETELAFILWEKQDLFPGGYFAVHSIKPLNESLMAVSVDLHGDERYEIYLIHAARPTQPTRMAQNTSGVLLWAQSKAMTSLHYIGLEPGTQRSYQWNEVNVESRNVTTHYTETKVDYYGDILLTTDASFVVWTSRSSMHCNYVVWNVNERLLNGNMNLPSTTCQVDHSNQRWWILDTEKSSLYLDRHCLKEPEVATVKLTANATWNRFCIFPEHIVFQCRQDGVQQIWWLKWNTYGLLDMNNARRVQFANDQAHYVNLAMHQEYDSNKLLLSFESMVTPPRVVEMDFALYTKDDRQYPQKVICQQQIRGYDPSNYACLRLMVPSRNSSVEIPVSVVYRKGLNFPESMHLLGYGAYGHSLEPSFSTTRLIMLRRNITCAIAHVRGGGEMGSSWYKDGKAQQKQNSIDDFVDVSRWFVDNRWTRSKQLAVEGRSAGGLLVASAVNQQPNLFRTVALGAPFLDILCAMADANLPLTSLEFEEWGNPHTVQGFLSLSQYAPIQNVVENATYPSYWMMAGLHDIRAPYWDAMKLAAEIRRCRCSQRSATERPVLVKVDTDAGHSLGSNQTRFLSEIAMMYAFVINQIRI